MPIKILQWNMAAPKLKVHETKKQLFRHVEWYNLDHFGDFWSLQRAKSAANSKI
jgi:hypothetical protein